MECSIHLNCIIEDITITRSLFIWAHSLQLCFFEFRSLLEKSPTKIPCKFYKCNCNLSGDLCRMIDGGREIDGGKKECQKSSSAAAELH